VKGDHPGIRPRPVSHPSGVGATRAWVSFLIALALTSSLVWRAWTIVGASTYQGGDGKVYQSLLRMFREFAPAFHINILNPLQGAAGFAYPMNIWANPVYWPFFSDDRLFAAQASTLIAYIALSTALFFLARTWRLPLGASVAGSLSGIVVFPLFSFICGYATLLTINPEAAMSASLMIIAASLSYRVTDLKWKSLVGTALWLALALGYSVYSNPAWFVGAGFIFAPLFAFCILDTRSGRVIAARTAPFVIAFAFLYAAGLVDYIRTLFGYSSRIYFPSQWSRPQDLPYASWSFAEPRLLWVYLFFLSGWVVGLIFGDRRARKAILACLFLFAVFLIEVSVYLFAPIPWSATLPVYDEILMGPMYALGALVGYSSLVATAWHALILAPASKVATLLLPPGGGGRRSALLTNAVRAIPVLTGLAFVPALAAWYVNQEIYAGKYTPRLINSLTEPWPATGELVGYLRDAIGLQSVRRFRGAAFLRPYFTYESALVLADVWWNFIPTLNLYNTFKTPTFYYLELPWTYPHLDLDAPTTKMLQALGVRYVVQGSVEGEQGSYVLPDDALLRLELPPVLVASKKVTHVVYEYPHPNLGDYSPTKVVVAADAASTVQYLRGTSFDPRQSVILQEDIDAPLVPASGGRMFFERGAVRVQAESRATSIVLLPLQYSYCLRLSEAAKARLLPANLLQTALVFQGNIDLRIHFQYGVFSSRCRKKDLANLARLGIFDDKSGGPPQAQLHPYAISSWAELPRAVRAVIKRLAASP
jgi:hypothetical protein